MNFFKNCHCQTWTKNGAFSHSLAPGLWRIPQTGSSMDYSSLHSSSPRVGIPPSVGLFLSEEGQVNTHSPCTGTQGVCLSPIVSGWVALALGDATVDHGAIESSHRVLHG